MSVGVCLGGVTQSGTMICNLPLLFADGYPTCLDQITVDQLERFIPFMIRCSSGHISEKLSVPEWWPNDLEFSIPLVKPPRIDSQWLTVLKNLVFRCYTYHGCEFMLQFSTTLSQCPTQNLTFATCWDGTTSLYNKSTGSLLVTFRNENMFYDRRKESPRKIIIIKKNKSKKKTPLPPPPPLLPPTQIVQPRVFDVYLCDCCDEEFGTLEEVQDHEKICPKRNQESSHCVAPTEILNSEQEHFLDYFSLANSQDRSKQNDSEKIDPPRYKRFLGNALRYSAIPLTSPLGVLVNKKSRASNISSGVLLDRVERYCSTKPDSSMRIREQRLSSWPVSWKPRKKGEEEQEDWVHVYKHPKRQWFRRAPFMQDEASLKAMDLIEQCQRVEVRIRRLTNDEIKFHTTQRASKKCITTFNEVQNLYDQATYEHEELCVKLQSNESDLNPASLKTKPEFVENLWGNSEAVENVGPLPYERQLIPNTLYVYDRTAPTIGGSHLQNIPCSNLPIPVVDLVSSDDEHEVEDIVSSDDEHEVVPQREIQEHFTALHHNYGGSMYETDLNFHEVSTNEINYGNSISNYCSDYESDLPQLMNFLSSSTYQQDDEIDDCMFVTLDHRSSPTLGSEKSCTRSICDKSVQCTYEDFDSSIGNAVNDGNDRGGKGECCLVKEETCSQIKLPKLFKNRREL